MSPSKFCDETLFGCWSLFLPQSLSKQKRPIRCFSAQCLLSINISVSYQRSNGVNQQVRQGRHRDNVFDVANLVMLARSRKPPAENLVASAVSMQGS